MAQLLKNSPVWPWATCYIKKITLLHQISKDGRTNFYHSSTIKSHQISSTRFTSLASLTHNKSYIIWKFVNNKSTGYSQATKQWTSSLLENFLLEERSNCRSMKIYCLSFFIYIKVSKGKNGLHYKCTSLSK